MTEALESQINKYTEQLVTDPKSRVFVPLSDLYRKMGQYDEAIAVAQEGLKHHPHYVAGKMALARAHFENGDTDQAREILESVHRTSPDNILANRILSEVYLQAGEKQLALPLLKQLVALDPNDSKSKELLSSLQTGASPTTKTPVESKPAPVLQPPKPSTPPPATPPSQTKTSAFAQPKTNTATLANLYRSQGHYDKALEIYRELSAKEPMNAEFKKAVFDLESLMSPRPAPKESRGAQILQTLLVRISERRKSL